MSAYKKILHGITRKAQELMSSPAVEKRRKNIEKVLRRKLKQVEPRVRGAYRKVKKQAIRCGMPVSSLEERLSRSFEKTLARLRKAMSGKTSKTRRRKGGSALRSKSTPPSATKTKLT